MYISNVIQKALGLKIMVDAPYFEKKDQVEHIALWDTVCHSMLV